MYDDNDFTILKIPTAREKLLPNFPNDESKGDIKIIFKTKVFNLCKAYLRLESSYFKKICEKTCSVLEIKENFNEEVFEKVLSCFYGASVKMEVSEVNNYYQVIQFLEIESLINLLRKDILESIDKYDLFVVMKIAHQYSDQELFEVCLEELYNESFEQLKYHQFELLQTELPLFKLIIKAHNRHRNEGKPGISYSEIDQIIRDYCDGNGMNEDEFRAMKFELIDKTSLTAQEYKEIFLDEVLKLKNKVSTFSIELPVRQSIIVGGGQGPTKKLEVNKLVESVISPKAFALNEPPIVSANLSSNPMNSSLVGGAFIGNGVNELTFEMEMTFQKKMNEELKKENKMLGECLSKLKEITEENQKIHERMETELRNLKEELKNKEKVEQQHKKTINEFQNKISIMEDELKRKTESINKLEKKVDQISNNSSLSTNDDMLTDSLFIPVNEIEKVRQLYTQETVQPKEETKITTNSNEPDYKNMDDEDLEELYLPRISFDVEPLSTPKYNLPILNKFITTEGFSKHKLNLIYCRSLNHPSKGTNEDIRNKQNLLILINTCCGQNIGGFISVSIPKSGANYIKDSGAFLFSLTKNQKFPIKKTEIERAIFLSKELLISFGNDLKISNDCLKEKSECSWPSSYESYREMKVKETYWLVSENKFLIKSLDIYEMVEEEMEMIIS